MHEIFLSPIRLSDLELLIEKSVERVIERQVGLSNPTEEILSLEEFCEFTGMPKGTAQKKSANGELPSHKNGKRLYFMKSEVLDWLRKEKSLSK